jgi:hypothetical protein
MPTVPRKRPTPAMIKALGMEPLLKKIIRQRDMVIRLQYSGGPKRSPHPASLGAISIIMMRPNVPAINEAKAEMPRAGPARPFLAIWYPSRQVTTDEASPGIFTRIDVVDPPYWAP